MRYVLVATLEFIQHQLPKMGHGKPPVTPRLTQPTMPGESPCNSGRRANGLVQTRMSLGTIWADAKSPIQCAGINRHEAGNARVLRERSSEPLGPEFCVVCREAHGEA